MSEIASAFVRIRANMTGFRSEVEGGTRSAFGGVGKIIAGAFAVGAAAEFGKKIAESGLQAQEQTEQLTRAFKNQKIAMTGSSPAVLALEEHSRQLGFTNESVRDGLVRLIQGGDSYKQALKDLALAQDVSRSKGMALGDVTSMLIRTHTGATRAVRQFGIIVPPVTTAVDKLKASHIDLTTATGKAALAQAKIQDKLAFGQKMLDVLNSKVHGAAQGFSETAAGGMARFSAAWDNLKEKMGTAFLPVLGKVADLLTRLIGILEAHSGAVRGAAIAVGVLTAAFLAFELVTSPIFLVAAAVAALGVALYEAYQHSATFRAIVQEIGNTLKAVLGPAVQAVTALIHGDWQQAWFDAQRAFAALPVSIREKLGEVASIATSTFSTIRSIVQGAITAILFIWQNTHTQIVAVARATWTMIQGTVQAAMNIIRGIINIVGGLIHGDWSRVWQGIQQLFSGIIQGIETTLRFFGTMFVNILRAAGNLALAALSAPLNSIKTLAVNTFHTLETTVTNTAHTVVAKAKEIGTGIVNGIESGLAAIVRVVKGGLDKIWSVISGVAKSAFNAAKAIGAEIVHGIASGIEGAISSAWHAIEHVATSTIDRGLHVLHIRSPSALAATALGAPIVQGIAKGMLDAEPILGATLARALLGALKQAEPAAKTGMGNVANIIIAAAQKAGVDARAALAVAMQEGGTKFGAVGDAGTSFGPFQLHIGGASPFSDPSRAAAFANSIQGVTYALKQMAAAGAAGKTGFDAIQAIVRGFERPANPEAEIAKALAAYNKLPSSISTAAAAATPAVAAAHRRMMEQIAVAIQTAAPFIGVGAARQIALGFVQQQPTLAQQITQALTSATDQAKTAWSQKFDDMATAALGRIDAAFAKWVPPTQLILNKMQKADAAKQIADQLAGSLAAIQGGGAAMAQQISTTVGPAIGNATARAMQEIAGAKTMAALNTISVQASNQVTAAIDRVSAAAVGQAAAAVTAAQTALDQAKAAGASPEEIAAKQTALDDAVKAQQDLNTAVQTAKEQALQPLVDAEARKGAAITAQMKTDAATQIAQLKTDLAQHPKEWDTSQKQIITLLSGYLGRFTAAGTALARAFAAGITSGIPAVRTAADNMAAAARGSVPASPSAKRGPLAFNIIDKGREWASLFAVGVAQATPAVVPGARLPAGIAAGGLNPGAMWPGLYDLKTQGAEMLGEMREQTALLREGFHQDVNVHVPGGKNANHIALAAAR